MLLSACSRRENESNIHLMTITPTVFSKTLSYPGIIEPKATWVVSSPADGVIVDDFFQYGDTVKVGELLFKIDSSKFLSDYKIALMQYIKAKNEFNTSLTQLSEGKFLYRNQLISTDDFRSKQASYYAAQLALLQSKDTLGNLLHELNIKNINFYALTIEHIDQITKALHLQLNTESLAVLAPYAGMVLAPSKDDESNKKLAKGDVVKQGDVLAMIGEMDGLTLSIKVNELTINQL